MALGLMLIVEGWMPMVSPLRWRRLFEQLLKLEDGQIRFFGMGMVITGLLLFWPAGRLAEWHQTVGRTAGRTDATRRRCAPPEPDSRTAAFGRTPF